MGDEILEINGRSTENIPHADAIALIKSGGNRVHLLIHRSNKPVYYGKLHKFLAMTTERCNGWRVRHRIERSGFEPQPEAMCLCSWAGHFTLTVPLFKHVY